MFFDFLFGRKQSQPAPVPTPQPSAAEPRAPGTQIAYNADLVGQLKAEHQKLLGIFAAIKGAFERGDNSETARQLEEFRSAIQGHLLLENVRLYIYLEHALAQDAESHTLVRAFRHEMDGIGRAVLDFLGKYKGIGSQPNLAASFGGELDRIGEVLVARIRREEETLYPLYLPAY